MKSYTVRDIPDDQYKALRIIAAEMETSINKAILKAIKDLILKGKEKSVDLTNNQKKETDNVK